MKISDLDPDHLSQEQITQLLFPGWRDDGRPGDCIFVFGSKHAVNFRVPKAVSLYQAGRAPRILCSGGAVWEDVAVPEALVMKRAAVSLGVPEDAILTEIESQGTKENVICSLLTLDRAFQLQDIRRLLVVTTAFHMRRCYLVLKTYMPAWIRYSLCPVDDRTSRADNWWLHPDGVRNVRLESRRVIEYVRMGAMIDDDLDIESAT
ncbi:MAG: YdcF family protein [Clostridia bacterium]